jgi:hypothetical protein
MIDVDKVQAAKTLVFGERRSGRTTRCIRYAAKNKATIVCPTMKDVDRITITAERLGCEIPYPITVQQFLDSWRPNNQSQSFVIDDLDRILNILARGCPIVTEMEIRLMEE